MATRRALRTGLPRPLVDNAELQQWIDGVSDIAATNPNNTSAALIAALISLGLLDRNGNLLSRGGGRLTTGAPTRQVDGVTVEVLGPVGVPTVAAGLKPVGFSAAAGIGVVGLWWDNPWNHYANHAVTRIYRHSLDEFNNAVELGTSTGISYLDETPADNADETWWYWARWETTTSILGPPTDGLEVETSADPAITIAALSAEIRADPFAQELLEPVGFDRITDPYIRRLTEIQGHVNTRIAEIRDRISESISAALDREQSRQAQEILLLVSGETQTGGSLGPAPNTFTGASRAATETGRDAQASADPAWLSEYDNYPDFQIQLDWT